MKKKESRCRPEAPREGGKNARLSLGKTLNRQINAEKGEPGTGNNDKKKEKEGLGERHLIAKNF